MRIATRLGLALVIVFAVAALGLWQFGPELGNALPERVRPYLPAPVLAAMSEPLPDALPAPQQPVPVAAVDPLLDAPSTAVPLPTPSVRPSPTPEQNELAEAPASTPMAVVTPAVTVPLPTATATATPRPLPAQVRLNGVDIVPQKFNNCGPANLSMVLGYHGLDHDQLAVAAVIRPTYEDRNVSPQEMATYVREQTELAATVFHGGTLEQLRALLAAGLPVIVEKGLEDDGVTGWMGHYLTLYGYDDAAREFLARDTFLGPWEEDGYESYDSLLRQWRQFNNVLIVVHEPVLQPVVDEILGPGADDPAAMWASAVEQARAAVRANADDAFAWFNLGSSLAGQAQLTGDPATWSRAAASFDQARLHGLPARMLWYQFMPYEAYLAAGRPHDVVDLAEATLLTRGGRAVEETYLYLGHARRALGEEMEARLAYEQAVTLSPTSATAAAAQAALAVRTP